jgi:1,4-alpha-glucan branching enzyme
LGSVHLHADKNHILLKVVGDSSAKIAFALGNDDNIAADEFNNDLAELVEGYKELLARADATEETPAEARRLVTFHYEDAEAGAVSVVGSFNGWSPETHRLQKLANGSWELTMSLAPGRYSYRFLIDQKKQVLDPSTALTEPDGYGGKNSVVVVKR